MAAGIHPAVTRPDRRQRVQRQGVCVEEKILLAARRLLLLVLLNGLLPTQSWAQVTPPVLPPALQREAQRQGDAIQQQQQQIQREQRDAVLRPDRPQTSLELEAPDQATPGPSPCFPIARVELSGVTLLSEAELADIRQPASDCLDAAAIDRLLKTLTARYIDKGYVGVRVYLPAQRLADGFLRLEVVEGQLTRIGTTPGAETSIRPGNLLPGALGKPLNLRDLEQALEQANRLRSNDASIRILPGEQRGDSEVLFDNRPGFPLHASVSVDNRGQRATGRQQLGASLVWDNPLRLNDVLGLNQLRSLPEQDGRRRARANSLFYALPFGYHTLGAGVYDSRQQSLITTFSGIQLPLSNTLRQYSLNLDSVHWRGRAARLTSDIGLTHKQAGTELAGIRLGVSSYRLTLLEAGVAAEQLLAGGTLRGRLGFTQGMPWLDASPEVEVADYPSSRFSRINLQGSFLRPFDLGLQRFIWLARFDGQYTSDALYASEQFAIGGLYSVRGFAEQVATSGSGFFLSSDLRSSLVPFPARSFPVLQPYAGCDYGRLLSSAGNSYRSEMTSCSVGLDLFWGQVRLELLASHPFYWSNDLADPGQSLSATLQYEF